MVLLAKFDPGDTFQNPMTDSVISSHARGSARAQDATGRAASTRPDHKVYRGLQAALLGALLMIGAASSEAQSPVKQVLLLQTFDRGNLVLDHFTGEFRLGLDQPAGRPLNVVQVVVGPRGFVGAPDQAIVDYIRSMFADRPAPRRYSRASIGGSFSPRRRSFSPQWMRAGSRTRHLAGTRLRWRSPTIFLDSSTTSCRYSPRPGKSSCWRGPDQSVGSGKRSWRLSSHDSTIG